MNTKKVNIQLKRRFVETTLSSFDKIRERFAKNAAAEKAFAEKAAVKKAAAEKAAAEKAASEKAAAVKAAAAKRAAAKRDAAQRAAAQRAAAEEERIEQYRKAHLKPLINIGYYRPSWGGQNPRHDQFSRDILTLKDPPSDARTIVIDGFVPRLEPKVPMNHLVICVPSSNPATQDRGLSEIARRLCDGGLRENADGNLYRTEKIEPAHLGGSRDIEVHLKSMSVKDPTIISGKDVILLDDVTTTGQSFRAAGKKLHECGARTITPIALGLTYNGD